MKNFNIKNKVNILKIDKIHILKWCITVYVIEN